MKSLSLTFNTEGIIFVISKEAPLSWLSFAIEAAAQWVFGHNVFTLSCGRSDLYLDAISVHVTPLKPAGEFEWSAVAELRDIPAFPLRLIKPWPRVAAGESVMIQMEGVGETAGIGKLAYHFADTTTDLFNRGASLVEAQYSFERIQIRGNARLDAKSFMDFADPKVRNYKPNDLVGGLPEIDLQPPKPQ